MGKGKGHQAGHFASKSLRAQYQKEWQAQIPRRRSQSKQGSSSSSTLNNNNHKERPRIQLRCLRGILQERQYADHMQDRYHRRRMYAHQQQHQQRSHYHQTPFTPHSISGHRSGMKHGTGSSLTGSSAYSSLSSAASTPLGWIFKFDRERRRVMDDVLRQHHNTYNDDSDHERRNHFDDDPIATLRTNTGIPSLQSLCLNVLGRHLVDYVEALGKDALHAHLSSLSAQALEELSILVSSSSTGMTNDVLYCLANHGHVQGLCIAKRVAADEDEEDVLFSSYYEQHQPLAPSYSNTRSSSSSFSSILPLTPEVIQQHLLPKWGFLHHVPDSWEDDDEVDEGGSAAMTEFTSTVVDNGTCTRLKRLELAHLMDLDSTIVLAILEKIGGGLTHLSFRGSFRAGQGASEEVLWQLSTLCPMLQVLDLSYCGAWLTEGLVRRVIQSYHEDEATTSQKKIHSLLIKVQYSLTTTDQVALEMDYPHHIWTPSITTTTTTTTRTTTTISSSSRR